ARGEIGNIDHLLHFALAFGENLAAFERYQRSQVVFHAAELLADLAHHFAALGRWEHTPALERAGGLPQDLVVVLFGGHLHAAKLEAIGRVVGNELAATGRVDPFAIARTGIRSPEAEARESIVHDAR